MHPEVYNSIPEYTVDRVCLEKSILMSGLQITSLKSTQWLFFCKVNNSKAQLGSPCFTAPQLFSFLMLSSLALFSSYRSSFSFLLASQTLCVCVCLTSGRNLKRPSGLPGYHTEWIKHRWQAMEPKQPWVVPRDLFYQKLRSAKAVPHVFVYDTYLKNKKQTKTNILPYSDIAETWPNLLAFTQQAPSGLQTPKECNRSVMGKYAPACTNKTIPY